LSDFKDDANDDCSRDEGGMTDLTDVAFKGSKFSYINNNENKRE
jgi:hypothetical protein